MVKKKKMIIFFNITQVTDSIFMLSGGRGNVAVWVGDDGIFLIDDKFNGLTEKLLSAIREIS